MSVDVAELVLRVESLEVKQAARELEKFRNKGAKAEKQMSYLETRSKSVSNQFSRLKGILAGGVFTLGIKGAVNMVDGYKNVNALLNIVSNSQKEFLQTQQELFEVAQNNYSGIAETTKLYAGQAKQLETLGYQHSQQIAAVDLFSKALATSGATTTEASSATLQWVQALGSGVLRGQEFNSIMENGRGVAIALADGLNTTIGNLRNMALAGKLSAKTVVDGLLSQEEAIKAKFSKIPITVAKAWTQLRNSATVAVSKINSQIGDASGSIANFISSISKTIDSLDFDRVIISLKAMGSIILVTLIPAIASMTLALATNPFFLLVAGIAAVGVAVYKFADDMIVVGNRTATVADFIGGAWDYIKEKATQAFDSVKEKWTKLKEFVTVKFLSDNSKEYLEIAKGYFSSFFNFVVGFWIGAVNSITEGYRLIPNALKDITVQTLNGMISIFETGLNTIVLAFYNIPYGMGKALDFMIEGMKKIPAAFKEIFRSAMAGATNFITKGVNKAIDLLNKILPDSKQIAKAVESAADGSLKAIDSFSKALDGKAVKAEDIFQFDFNRIENDFKGKGAQLGDVIFEEFEKSLSVDYAASIGSLFDDGLDQIGKNAELRRFAREVNEEFEGLGKTSDDVSEKLGGFNNKLNASGEISKTAKKKLEELKSSQKALSEGYVAEVASLDRRTFALTASTDQLFEYDLAQERFGKNQLKYNDEQLKEIANRNKNIELLEKQKEESERFQEVRKNALETMQNFYDQSVLQFELIEGLTEAESKKFAADKKAYELRKNALKTLEDNKNKLAALRKELSGQQKDVEGLTNVQNKQNQTILKNIELVQKQIDQSKKFKADKEALNKQIKYQTILNTEGAKAARLYHLENEYGNRQRAEQIQKGEEILKHLEKEGDFYESLKSTFKDFISGAISSWSDLRDAITTPIVANLKASVTQSVLGGSGLEGLFGGSGSTSSTGILGGISKLFKGGLSNIGTNIASMFSSGLSGITSAASSIGSLLTGGGLTGGIAGLASSVTAALGPIGLAVSAFKLLKSVFGGVARLTIGQGTYARGEEASAGVRWNGSGYRDQDFVRESAYGDFGVIGGGRSKRVSLGGEFGQAVAQTLDLMQQIDNAAASLQGEASNEKVKVALQNTFQRDDDKINLEELLSERLDTILSSSHPLIQSLVDVNGSVEEQTQRLSELSYISNTIVPSLEELGFNLVKKPEELRAVSSGLQGFKDAIYNTKVILKESARDLVAEATYNATKLIELAGGADALNSAYANYQNKLFSEEEKSLKQKQASINATEEFNRLIGLEGTARIQSAEGLKMYIQGLESSGELATEEGRQRYLAALAAVNDYTYLQSLTEEENQQRNRALIEEAELLSEITAAFSETGGVLSLIKTGSIEAQEGLVGLAGGIESLSGLMSGYISNILSEDEQKIYQQVSAAQQLQALANELSLDVSQLDTREEFKKLVSAANNEALLATEAGREGFLKLLEASESVAILADSGQSLVDVIANAPADILDFAQSSQAENLVDQFQTAVEHSSQIAENINDIDYSIDKIIDIRQYNRDAEQEKLAAIETELQQQKAINQRNENTLQSIAVSSSNMVTALRRIDAKTVDGAA